MPETFFILLAGGIMLAAAVCDPDAVTLNWLRLCGILALAMAGLAAFFLFRAEDGRGAMLALGGTAAAVCGQLGFAQVAMRRIQRAFAAAAYLVAVAAAVLLLQRRSAWDAFAGAGVA